MASADTIDVRVNCALFEHPKLKKLRRRLGYEGCFRLIHLFAYARQNNPDGSFVGMSDEDIELAVNWAEDRPGEFIAALLDVRFMEGEPGARCIHDWAEHNPFSVDAPLRSIRSAWAVTVRHHGYEVAAKRYPDYAAQIKSNKPHTDRTPSEQDPNTDGVRSEHKPHTPAVPSLASPSPAVPGLASPDQPKPSLEDQKPPADAGNDPDEKPAKPVKQPKACADFERWWAEYPSKVAKVTALKAWNNKTRHLEPADRAALADVVLSNIRQRIASDTRWKGGFVPNPTTYVNQERYYEAPYTLDNTERRTELRNAIVAGLFMAPGENDEDHSDTAQA